MFWITAVSVSVLSMLLFWSLSLSLSLLEPVHLSLLLFLPSFHWTVAQQGAVSFGESIATNVGLRKLHLANNQLDSLSVQALALGLCDHQTMQFVDLKYNKIQGKAALVLASALEKCLTLNTLILDHNPIGKGGLKSILRAIHSRSAASDNAPRWLTALQPVHVRQHNIGGGRRI